MRFDRLPRVPARSLLTWRIARLRLDEAGTCWWATAFKGTRVATIRLPDLGDSDSEEAWLSTIEAALERNAQNVVSEEGAPSSYH
jgi:hypothetical protein